MRNKESFMEGKRIIILCRDRKCKYNCFITDTCAIDEKITIAKGKCADRVKTK